VEAGFCLLAYLLGSIPTAYIIAKIGWGIDIRKHGSGNVGTMNTRAVLGLLPALLVLLLDIFKGALAVIIARYFGINTMLTACLVVTGHIYPVWLHFQGGKGLATALGAILVTEQYLPIILFAAVWIITFPLFRQVDKSNMSGTVVILLYSLIGPNWYLALLAAVISLRHGVVLYKQIV
jgi:glycerol-3-phosphate acyltransferase PlsY